MEKHLEEIFENRAHPEADGTREVICPHCDEMLVFAMKDREHEFSIGLSSILECMVIAEHMGHVPPFSDEWWASLVGRYPFLVDVHNRLERQDEKS